MKYDIAIIGSGLGGLTCGAMLAKSGKRVIVLEQHNIVGGCATCFKRKGMLIDAGLHELDFGEEKYDMKHIIFHKLGLFDRIKLIELPSAWSIKILDERLDSSQAFRMTRDFKDSSLSTQNDVTVESQNDSPKDGWQGGVSVDSNTTPQSTLPQGEGELVSWNNDLLDNDKGRYVGHNRHVEHSETSLDSKDIDSKIRSKIDSTKTDSITPNITSFTIPHKNTQKALIEMFKHEESGIRAYFRKLRFYAFINRRFPYDMGFLEFFFAPVTTLCFLCVSALKNVSTGERLDRLFKDSKLKKILNINMAYYHNNPYEFIFSYHALAQNSYYNQGMYIKGGSQALSDSLADIIRENGGEVLVNADVKQILVKDKKAHALVYVDKKSKDSITIKAEKIIANCDPRLAYEMLCDDSGGLGNFDSTSHCESLAEESKKSRHFERSEESREYSNNEESKESRHCERSEEPLKDVSLNAQHDRKTESKPHKIDSKPPLDSKEYARDSEIHKKLFAKTSLMSIYMVFDKNLSQIFTDMDYSTFCIDSAYYESEFNENNESVYNTPLQNRGFVFVNYSKIDSGLSDRDDRYFGVITTTSIYDEWLDNGRFDSAFYKAKKEEIKAIYERRLEAFFPGIMQHCIHSELATPLSIERYTRAKGGVIYGYEQNKEGFMGRHRYKSRDIENLYFASAFGFPGGGFTGAMMSGYRVARKIMDKHFYIRQLSFAFIFGIAVSLLITELVKVVL